jgi:DNA-binding NarL/FixJ family response regulator
MKLTNHGAFRTRGSHVFSAERADAQQDVEMGSTIAVSAAAGLHRETRIPLKSQPFETKITWSGVMTQILIADDHEVVRQGVRVLLEANPEWSVCCEAATGREAVAKATEFHPDVVVLDIAMPEMNGLEAARQIRRAVPTAKILVLTVHQIDQLAQEFIDAGVRGYLLKADAGRMLVDAVKTVLKGEKFFTPSLVETADGSTPARASTPSIKRLTHREREVLQLLAEGKSNKEIGTALSITTKTAETHRARLMAKLGVHSVADLVRYAIRNKIVEP